ncbi:hypothetical protein [Absidia glauca]|uniref:Uncharacterized protein n=1 Tax=Absidia glauca TaxID=4829 RepID=A0A163ME48_ABSGL|nr:hypothetical protein [Absidia glauca]
MNREKLFDAKYSLDLDGFMTPQEFVSKINAFNQVAREYPPPPSPSSEQSTTLIGCSSTLVILTVIASIHYTHHLTFILTIPFTLLLLSSILIGWRRRLAKKFEKAMYTCTLAMNASDNVRGVNFRFCSPSPNSSDYAITIEFDERYHLLHHYTPSSAYSDLRRSYLGEASPPYTLAEDSPHHHRTPPPFYSPSPPPNSYQPNEKL